MLDYNQVRSELDEYRKEIVRAYESINPKKVKDKIKELSEIQNGPNFWDDADNAKVVSKQLSQLQSKIEKFESLIKKMDDAIELVDIVELEESDDEDQNLLEHVSQLKTEVEKLSLATLLSGKYDALNAILTLHAGAGGTEAQDWCDMLYRMYKRYCERVGWDVTLLIPASSPAR